MFKVQDVFPLVWNIASSRVIDSCRNIKSEEVAVTTKAGPVKGFKVASAFKYHYLYFLGIPYAKPPIGELRFKDPQPFEPNESNDVINAQFQRSGSMACQPNLLQGQWGAENCLHLSVFTRDIKPDVLKPVMVWIHGGAFRVGSNSKDIHSPEFLLRHDVVVITINYRLGAIGFLSLNDPKLKIPGNAGLKDQCLALKWAKENCADFGGDPNNITVFGESAGGASVHYHMVSEMSKGLFHKAIVMSGTVHAPWALVPMQDWTKRLSKELGWNGEGDDRACLAVIQNSSSESIIKAQEALLVPKNADEYFGTFSIGPTIESFKSEQSFLLKDPKELAINAWSNDMPVIFGSCSDEALLMYKMLKKNPKALEIASLAKAVPYLEFGLDADDKKCHELGEVLKKFYFGYTAISKRTIWTFLMLLGDKLFVHPMHRALVGRSNGRSGPMYLYRFSFSSYSFGTKKLFVRKKLPGACHADDVAYVFKMILFKVPKKSTNEWKTIERMCGCFTQFARTGNPNHDVIAPIYWEPVELSHNDVGQPVYKCLNIDDEISLIEMPELERMHLWDKLYDELRSYSHQQNMIPRTNGE